MKFRFTLDPVLRVREKQEKLQKQKLAGELKKRKEVERLRQKAEASIREYAEQGTGKATDIHTVRRFGRHVEQARQQAEKLELKLRKVNKAVSRERGELAELHKSKHVLEKLKESQHEIYLRQVSREEQKMMDELAMHNRNSG